MTSTGTPRPARSQQLQEDLLQDLMHTAPLPAPRPTAKRAPATGNKRPGAARGQAPTVELVVTPTRWTPPSVRSVPGKPGLVLTAGPIRVSLSRFGS